MEDIKYYKDRIQNCLDSVSYTVTNFKEDIYEIIVYYKKDSTLFIKRYGVKKVYSFNTKSGETLNEYFKAYIDNNIVEFTDLLFDIVDIKPFIIAKPILNTTTSTTTSFSNRSNFNTTEWIKTNYTTST